MGITNPSAFNLLYAKHLLSTLCHLITNTPVREVLVLISFVDKGIRPGEVNWFAQDHTPQGRVRSG